jgi:hypothetical protein
LVEVGASAGLNLLFDRYGYDYGADRFAGIPGRPSGSPARCAVRRFHRSMRYSACGCTWGIDLNPIHADDPQAMLWLRALIWPEHPERAALLQQVLALAQREPPPLIAGDVLTVLPRPSRLHLRARPCACSIPPRWPTSCLRRGSVFAH